MMGVISSIFKNIRVYIWGFLILVGLIFYSIKFHAFPFGVWCILTIQLFVLYIAMYRIISVSSMVDEDNEDIDILEDAFRENLQLCDNNSNALSTEDRMLRLIHILRANCVLATQIEYVYRLGLGGHSVDVRQLNELMYDEITNRVSTFRVLLASTLLLGLFGTVLGLSWTVKNIQPLFDELRQLSEVYTAMGESFGGMQTAFVTTIVGIISSLYLNIFPYRIYKRKFHFWKKRLDRTTILDLIPLLSSEPQTKVIEKATENLGEMADVVKDSVRVLAQQTKRIAGEMTNLLSFISVFDSGSQRIAGSLDSLGEHYEYMQKTHNKIADSIEKVNSLVDTNINSVSGYHNDLTTYQNSVSDVFKSVEILLSDLKSDRIDFSNMISRYVETLEETRKFLNSNDTTLANRYQILIDSIDEIGNQLSLSELSKLVISPAILSEQRTESSIAQSNFIGSAVKQLDQIVERSIELNKQIANALVQAGFSNDYKNSSNKQMSDK